jgi:hypothetical protein
MTKNLKIRNFPLIIISMLMISAIFYSATAVRPALAQETPTGMFVVPQDTILTNAEVGTPFSLNVSIANVTGFVGVEWRLDWNSSLMNCTSITENLYTTVTPADEDSQGNIWKLNLKYNNTAGVAYYAYTYQDLVLAADNGYAPINITSSDYPEGLATAILNFTVNLAPPVNSYYDCNFTFEVVNVGDMAAQNLNVTGQTGYFRMYGPPETTDTVISFEGNDYTVTTVTNASFVPDSMEFAKLNDSSYKLDFNLTGTDGATAYVNVTVPKALMSIGPDDQWIVNVNGEGTTPIVTSDDTNWYLYVTTTLSTNNVEIWGTIPEYAMLFIPLLMATTLVAFGLRRRRKL